jgi:indole-3-glycerol phosphate synthase
MSILDDILAARRVRVRELQRERPWSELEQAPLFREPRRSLAQALRRGEGSIRFLCEIKRASPSAGPIRLEANAAEIAASYVQGGASALSLITEEAFFQGRLDDLPVVREAGAPVLMKDFIVDPYQLVLGRALGADGALLIAAVDDRSLFAEARAAARDLSLEILVEVHAEEEIELALSLDPELIGVNHRDLRSFRVDLGVSEKLLPLLPASATRLAESGIRARADVEVLERRGFDALLVGESLMRAPDPGRALLALRGIDPAGGEGEGANGEGRRG